MVRIIRALGRSEGVGNNEIKLEWKSPCKENKKKNSQNVRRNLGCRFTGAKGSVSRKREVHT